MKISTWFQMSVLVALVISVPLVLLGMSKEAIGVIALAGGGLVMLATGRRRPPPQG